MAPGRGLTREKILEAALRLIDEEGLPALSMRRLGQELGVEAMALYKYVVSKQALLDGVVGLTLAGLNVAADGSSEKSVRESGASILRGRSHGCLRLAAGPAAGAPQRAAASREPPLRLDRGAFVGRGGTGSVARRGTL